MTRVLFLTQALLTAGLLGLVGALLLMPFVTLADSAGARAVGSPLEAYISSNGTIVVRGAQVTDISGDTLIAETDFGDATVTWRVDTDANTKYVSRVGSGSDFDDISDGDYISFSGDLQSGSTLTVDAGVVKNWSLVGNMRMTFYGQVEDPINDDTDRFVLDTDKVDNITVDADSSTIRDEDGDTVSFASLDKGDYVWVTGIYDPDDDILEASSIVRDDNENGSRDIKAAFDFKNGNGWGFGNVVKQWAGFFEGKNNDRDNGDRR